MKNTLCTLIVEDSSDDAEMLIYELKRGGYEVQSQRVETAQEMQDALKRQEWDIIVSDFSMPHFSGEDALRILQATDLDIPFIMLSGAIGEERAVEIMRAGANDYVMKDNLQRLVPAIQRELRDAEERRARRVAEEQVHKLSRALEQSASLVMITDIDGVIEYVNQAFTQVTGYRPDEVIGMSLGILKSATSTPELYHQMWETIRTGTTWRGEIQNRKKNGETYWAEVVVSAIKNSAGEIIQYLTVEEDVTERKRLEAELREYTDQLEQKVEERTYALRLAKEEIELILNNSNDAIALTNLNGDMRTYNKTFKAFFGNEVMKHIERILWLLEDEEHVSSVGDALIDAIYNNNYQRVEAQITLDSGTRRDVELTFIPVQATSDVLQPNVLVCAHDITHIKEIERFKERFVADAVHDLATPIAGLSTRLYLLRRMPEKLDMHMDALENQVAHLRDLLGDLRTLSQLDRGQLMIERAPCDLNPLVQRVFDTYEPVAIDKQQTLRLSTASDLPNILLDSQRIERVLVNLISNAVNYSPEGKTIRISTRLEEKDVVFEVQDQGIGIEPEALSHIFDRFYRTDTARQTQSSGTGLGLAITKEIIEMHGGKVSVKSQVGIGSTFTVYLPVTQR